MTDRSATPSFTHDATRDLLLERLVDVPVELVWKAWTTPEHLLPWFAPRPYETIECEIDLRPGGIFRTVMRSPEGEIMDGGAGCYLEVHAPHRLVWTNGLEPGYRPLPPSDGATADELRFTAELTFEAVGDSTRYSARVVHATPEAAGLHERMGFHDGWSTAADQLAEHMRGLRDG